MSALNPPTESPSAVVRDFLSRHVREEERLLLAVSGGPDSMGLLDLVAKCHRNISVLHVDHGIRPESSDEYRILLSYADKLGIRTASVPCDVPTTARERRQSIEHVARCERYRLLEAERAGQGADWILTGHTLEDSAETVLMRMRSGAPWYEWTGIPARRDRILRPLLSLPRGSIRAWVDAAAVPYVQDSSNEDRRHRRNALRADLAAKPEFWTVERMTRIAQQGSNLARRLAATRAALYATCLIRKTGSDPHERGLEINRILSYFTSLGFLPVEAAWAQLTRRPNGRLPSATRRQVLALLGATGPAPELALPGGVSLLKRGPQLWLIREAVVPVDHPVSAGVVPYPERRATLRVTSLPGEAHAPLRVRTWRPGDRLREPGRPRKKVSDILAERRLSPLARARALVLCGAEEPLCLLSEKSFVTEIDLRPAAPRIRVEWTCN